MNAATIIAGLVQRGIPMVAAQGIVANMMAESGLNPGINEAAPVVPGSRGGYGLNQWTGPRRVQYEAFARSRGASPDDLNTQLDFTVWELQNSEKAAGNALLAAPDVATATQVYSNQFLRPGVPHMDQRLAYAQQLAGQNAFAPPQAQQPAQNSLTMTQAPAPQWALFDTNSLPRNRLRA
jgi:hypothetical protein